MLSQKMTPHIDEGCGLPKAIFSSHTEKSSSLPGSSRELAEIFGTSDDEEDMDFPFSLNVDKTFPDLNLADGRVSEFFFKSLNSLSVPVSMDSALVSSPDMVGEKLIPGLPKAVVAASGMEVKGVNVIPEMEGVNTSTTGVEGVNTVSAGVGGGEGRVEYSSTEGVKAAGTCDMDTTCAEDSRSEDTSGKVNYVTTCGAASIMVAFNGECIRDVKIYDC